MEELSIAEKAMRYDVAVKKEKSKITGDKDHILYEDDVIDMFPELKEGERIRKSLAAYFAQFKPNDMWDDDFSFGDIVAWFEAQGEQKFDTDFYDLRTWKYIVDAVLTKENGIGNYLNSARTEAIAKELQERFGKIEQKPAEYTLKQAAGIFLDALSNTPYNNKPITDAQVITKELLKFLEDTSSYNPNAINEQKPADKFKVGDVIRPKGSTAEYTIESISGGCYRGNLWRLPIGCDDDYELVEQNVAWSEGDEAGLGDAMWAIEQARTIAKDENDMGNLWYAEHWLKSLKDRYTWKPSEEQMDALRYVFNHYFPSATNTLAWDALQTIELMLEQLKKLKG